MSKNPFNLALRFILELLALAALGLWGYQTFEGALKIIASVMTPLMFALIWGIFAVRGDPSRSGKTVVPTSGLIRLILELVFFGLAVWALVAIDLKVPAIIIGVAVFFHYVVSLDRVLWLIKEK